MLASVTSSITGFVGNHGVYAVFALMLIDAVFPAGSELVMLYAGVVAGGVFAGQHVVVFGWTASYGVEAWIAMSLAGTLGYTAGALVGWAIGDYGGRPLLERHGRWFHLDGHRLDRAERWFGRYGGWAVFLGRITPLVRSFISIPAGVFRDPLGRYTLLTLVGSAIWAFAFAAAGWGIGRSWQGVHDGFRYVDYAFVALALAVLAWIAFRVVRSARTRRASAGR